MKRTGKGFQQTVSVLYQNNLMGVMVSLCNSCMAAWVILNLGRVTYSTMYFWQRCENKVS